MKEAMNNESMGGGYFSCCGMSRYRGHADICPRALTPPQAAESGLLEEALEALNVMTTAFAGYADTPAKREAVALADALLAKAGKPQTEKKNG